MLGVGRAEHSGEGPAGVKSSRCVGDRQVIRPDAQTTLVQAKMPQLALISHGGLGQRCHNTTRVRQCILKAHNFTCCVGARWPARGQPTDTHGPPTGTHGYKRWVAANGDKYTTGPHGSERASRPASGLGGLPWLSVGVHEDHRGWPWRLVTVGAHRYPSHFTRGFRGHPWDIAELRGYRTATIIHGHPR